MMQINGWLVFSEVVVGLMKYKPDIIISVHPLMQHIPLWVLKWQSLQRKVPFFTVVTDLNTCHPTWFVTPVRSSGSLSATDASIIFGSLGGFKKIIK